MSYILEALKLSEQSRRQNAVETQYSLLPAVVEEREPGPSWRYPLLAGALLVNAVALAIWLRTTAPASTPAVLAPQPTPATVQPAAAVAASASTQAVVPSATPTGPVGIASSPAIPLRAAAPSAAAHALSTLAAEPLAVKDATGNTVAAKPAKVDAAEEPIAAEGMPMSIRKQLPPLSVTGVVHNAEASNMVIINDRPLREGEEVAPGLTLEKILDNGVLFNFKGYRFKR